MWELRELASPDGETWTDRGSLGFDTRSGIDPALSIDGCILLCTIGQTTLFVAYRQPDGSFGPPAQLLSSTGYAIRQPVISPDRSMIWIHSDKVRFSSRRSVVAQRRHDLLQRVHAPVLEVTAVAHADDIDHLDLDGPPRRRHAEQLAPMRAADRL